MTTGNAAAMTVSQAAMAAAPQKSDCEELEKNNEDRRKHVGDNSGDKRLLNKNGKNDQEGTTISSAKFQPTGSNTATCASAHSAGVAHERFPSQFIEGGEEDVRSGDAPVMCSEDKKHRPPYKQKSGHAEARVFDALGDQKGLKIVFKIDWRPGSGGRSNLPCGACQRLMCIAMQECKHEIWLCNKKNEPKKLTQADCQSDPKGNVTLAARRSLVKKMR